MSLFKKAPVKTTPAIVSEPSFQYPIKVMTWNKHSEELVKLFKSLGLTFEDMEDGRTSTYLSCKLKRERDNEFDSNAVIVCAKPRGAKFKDYYDIGYIPSEVTADVMEDNKKVTSQTHYWSLKMYFDIVTGVEFSLSLKESKYK